MTLSDWTVSHVEELLINDWNVDAGCFKQTNSMGLRNVIFLKKIKTVYGV